VATAKVMVHHKLQLLATLVQKLDHAPTSCQSPSLV